MKNVFTKTGKKGEEKMQKRKTAETTGRVERDTIAIILQSYCFVVTGQNFILAI